MAGVYVATITHFKTKMGDSYLQSINPGEDGCLLSVSLAQPTPSSLVVCSEVSRGHTPEGKAKELDFIFLLK